MKGCMASNVHTACPVCGSASSRDIAPDRFDTKNRYLRCDGCGSGFSLLRAADPDETARIHTEAYYAPGHDELREVPAAEAYFLARLVRFRSAGRLLDVGCGRGRWLRYVKDRTSFDVEGVEPSPEAAEYARSVRGLTVRTGDLSSAGYDDGSFDVVYLRNVLEHVADPGAFAGELRRILKPGGLAAVHVPNDASLTNGLKRHLYRAGLVRECGALIYPVHLTGLTPDSLDLLFREGGFERLAGETLSKIRRGYEFPFVPMDIPLLPAAVLEHLTGRGNLILAWYERR
jgi:SAM-dependent methyltransferase